MGSFFGGNGRFAKHLSICILLIFLLQEEGKMLLGLLTVPFCLRFRLNPKNVHQRPTVALLCGPHVKGAQGISCGRHLSNHDVHVILFLPNFVKMLESITNELNLFSKTQGQQVSSVKGKQRRSRSALCHPHRDLCRSAPQCLPCPVAPSSGTAICRWLVGGWWDSRDSRGSTVEQLCWYRCFLCEQIRKSCCMDLIQTSHPLRIRAFLVQHIETASK